MAVKCHYWEEIYNCIVARANLKVSFRPKCVKSHHGLLVSLLNTVACDFTVTVVFRWLPLQCHIEAPDIHNLQTLGRPWKICRGEI